MNGGENVDYKKTIERKILQVKQPYCWACHRESNDYLEYPFNFCCESLKSIMHECRIPVLYDEEKKQFIMPHKTDEKYEVLTYCPWCGTELQKIMPS